jgi:gamma-glutamyltranspeptidase/glutathione hydrolase
MVVAPHHLAAQSGLAVLREGGDAIEATIAMAATCGVVYPHMTGIGGDAFWLIREPGKPPVAIEACGVAGRHAGANQYRERGLSAVPARGGLAALTVPGAVAGWSTALALSRGWGGRLPLVALLDDAIRYARDGMPVTEAQLQATAEDREGLAGQPGFAPLFLPGGRAPELGTLLRQPALARTLERLAAAGPDDFYRGDLARALIADLQAVGSPLVAEDLADQWARLVEPLSLRLPGVTLYNLPPPTQGLASLMILGVFDRLNVADSDADGFAHIHGLVEATKHAFRTRDHHITDPFYMTVDPADFLRPDTLDDLAAAIDRERAQPWPEGGGDGDTVWLGAADAAGRVVSCLHSLYWPFGAGVVLKNTGVVWQNRGASFSLNGGALNLLVGGRKPFHTLNPALAVFDDGRTLAYGTMGGEGQPQTQAALFTRYARFGQDLQISISAPRWLLGRTWGAASTTLKIEDRFPTATIDRLTAAGHAVELVDAFSAQMGHAGGLVVHRDGVLEAAGDPRSDGLAAGW